ncbi:MAG: tyrosine-type recombinase/integrase [Thermomicrobiales bacterium]
MGRTFGTLTATSDLPVIRFHDLRHTSATLLLAQGVHPKIVQERLGHADITMTLNRYSHVTPDMQRMAADTLDAALSDAS